MKILLTSDELGYRGTPRFLMYCALAAHHAGHDVCVWGYSDDGFAGDACRKQGIKVIVGAEAQNDALAFKPDIIHLHHAGCFNSSEYERLTIFKCHHHCRVLETSVFGLPDLSRHSPIELHSHISQWDLWRWRRWLWPLHQPGILLPYCLDTEAFRPLTSEFRKIHQIPADAFLVGRLGKTDWNVLNAALMIAMEKCPAIWVVTVGDYSAATSEYSIFKKFANRIINIPRLKGADELSRFYSACDVTVNFSPIGESFGYGIAESMSCGTPVVTLSKPRNDNAQIELAAPEYGGFPVNGAESAADTLKELAANRSLLGAAKEKCRDSIEQRYSLHVLGPKLLKTYELLYSTSARGKELERLFETNGFTTHIPESEILRQLEQVRGGLPSCIERLKMKLAYSIPNAFRIHQLMKS